MMSKESEEAFTEAVRDLITDHLVWLTLHAPLGCIAFYFGLRFLKEWIQASDPSPLLLVGMGLCAEAFCASSGKLTRLSERTVELFWTRSDRATECSRGDHDE